MNNIISAGILCGMLLAPVTLWAEQPLGIQSTGTEGKGNFLLELAGEQSKDDSLKDTTVTSIITLGATDQVDLSVEVPYLTREPSPATGTKESGMGDLRLMLKQQIFENEVKQSMGYEITVKTETGSLKKGLGNNNIVWGINLIDTQKCRECAFHLNVGYEAFGRDLKDWNFRKNYAILFGLAAEHKFTSSFRLMAKLSGENRKEAGVTSRPYRFLAGALYDISKSWYVDLGMRAGLNKYAEDYTVLAGTALRF
jgi:hypothetical protein